MIDLAALQSELEQIRSLEKMIRDRISEGYPRPGSWGTLDEIAQREKEIETALKEAQRQASEQPFNPPQPTKNTT